MHSSRENLPLNPNQARTNHHSKIHDNLHPKKIGPNEKYLSDPFYKAVREAFAREMEKRRKPGLPISVMRDGKIIDLNPQPKQTKTEVKKIKVKE